MFTGLIQHLGRVRRIDNHESGRRLTVDAEGWSHSPEDGESIAVNGVCLTVVSSHGGAMRFDVVPETLGRTSIGGLGPGSRVHLEHAARVDTLMGGHTVQGHVECPARIESIAPEGDGARMRFVLEEGVRGVMRAVVPKGSIAVDGISLTVASVEPGARAFEIALIPETMARTTLGGAREGGFVNIETDIIARTIAHQLEHYFRGIDG